MEAFAIIQLLLRYGPLIRQVVDTGVPIIKALQEGGASKVIPILEREGLKLFPKLTDPIKAVAAAADVLFNLVPKGAAGGVVKDTVWVQTSLNKLQNAGLEPDGSYGVLTKKAVEKFQAAHQPASGPVDGWAGPKTRDAITAELAKL